METMSIDDQISTDRTTYEEAHKGAASYLESRLAETDDRLDENFDIPVIDLAPSYSTALSDRQAVAAQIRRACTTSGFFYIANHGVSEHTRTVILEQSKRFYDVLSIDQKKELHIEKSKLGLGWEPSEYTSIAGDQECKEGFNFAYEAALDPTGGDGLYRNLDGTDYNGNMWPKKEDLPHFYEAVKEYYGAVSAVSGNVLSRLIHFIGTWTCAPPLSTLCALS
jgi:isopenicillin N synthase-like dioxygenase